MAHKWKPVKRYCRYCGAQIVGNKNNKNILKTQCPKCGAFVVSKQINRRHERIDIYIP